MPPRDAHVNRQVLRPFGAVVCRLSGHDPDDDEWSPPPAVAVVTRQADDDATDRRSLVQAERIGAYPYSQTLDGPLTPTEARHLATLLAAAAAHLDPGGAQ